MMTLKYTYTHTHSYTQQEHTICWWQGRVSTFICIQRSNCSQTPRIKCPPQTNIRPLHQPLTDIRASPLHLLTSLLLPHAKQSHQGNYRSDRQTDFFFFFPLTVHSD